MNRILVRSTALLALVASSVTAQRRQLTTADYDRAVRMLPQGFNGIQIGGSVTPTWLPDGRFWYRQVSTVNPGQSSVILVDPARGNRTTATDTSFISSSTAAGGRGTGRGGR